MKDSNEIIGYIEPACKNPAWILYVTNKGDAMLYKNRGPKGELLGEPIRVSAQKKPKVRVWCIGPDQTEYYAAHSFKELRNFYVELVGEEQTKEDFKAHCKEVSQSCLDDEFKFNREGETITTTWCELIEECDSLPNQISTGYN